MTNFKHTPGPWVTCDAYGPRDDGTLVQQENGSQNLIASCTGYFGREGALANARLIAAAPELLAALQASTHRLHELPDGGRCQCSQCEFIRMRDNAIRKAIGED